MAVNSIPPARAVPASAPMPCYEVAPVSPARAWWAVAVFTIALMFNFLDRQVMTLLVTPIKRDLGLSDTQISVLIGFMFVLFYLGVGIPISRLVDRSPRKWIIGAGIAFWSVMTAACGLAGNFWQLAIARMGVGVGESCNGPATYSMTADMFPREKLARAVSVINIGMVAGSGLALLVGGSLVVALTKAGDMTFPLLGTLRAWQLTFIIVGLPGVLIALLLVATVPEPPRRGEAPGKGGSAVSAPSLLDVLRFLGRWRAAFVPLVIATGVKSMLSFGATVWSPSFFERRFDWAPGTPGIWLGVVSLIVSPVGLLLGGWMADRRTAAGHDDANMRVVLWASLGVVPFAILFPLMPTPALALVMYGGSLFFGSIGAGPANAAVQVITPGRMRGTVSALYIAVFNVMGYGLGPLAVALLTEKLFHDAQMLPTAMALTAALLGPLGLYFSWRSLRPYTRAAIEGRENGY